MFIIGLLYSYYIFSSSEFNRCPSLIRASTHHPVATSTNISDEHFPQLFVEKSIWITPKSLFLNAFNSKTTSKRAFNSSDTISALTSINSATFVRDKRPRRHWGLNTCTCPADGDQQKAQCTDLKCPKVLASWRVKMRELDKALHPTKTPQAQGNNQLQMLDPGLAHMVTWCQVTSKKGVPSRTFLTKIF